MTDYQVRYIQPNPLMRAPSPDFVYGVHHFEITDKEYSFYGDEHEEILLAAMRRRDVLSVIAVPDGDEDEDGGDWTEALGATRVFSTAIPFPSEGGEEFIATMLGLIRHFDSDEDVEIDVNDPRWTDEQRAALRRLEMFLIDAPRAQRKGRPQRKADDTDTDTEPQWTDGQWETLATVDEFLSDPGAGVRMERPRRDAVAAMRAAEGTASADANPTVEASGLQAAE